MPIDFPTVKYGDPTVNPPSAPAATDLVQLRTAGGADRVAYLGNLAGIAPVAVSNDQALAYIGGAWASYSLTAAGRALSAVAGTANTFPYFSAANAVTLGAITDTGLSVLSAATQAAARTAIQAVGLSGSENVSGVKSFISSPNFNAGARIPLNQLLVFGDGVSVYGSLRSTGTGTLVVSGGPAGGGSRILLKPQGDAISTGQVELNASGHLSPATTNSQDIGASSLVWRNAYFQNAPIIGSDERLKTEARHLRDAEFKAASAIARLPAVWRWLNRVHGDENCEPEGREARKHFGPTVQAAIAVMEGFGLDPFAYSFICYDEWDAEEATYDEEGNELTPAREAGDRYSFRKEELLCFIVRALAQEIDGLAERVAALEAKT